MKSIKLNQIGILIKEYVCINAWGGGQFDLSMAEVFIPNGKATKDNILGAVNDNGFGCESIESAEIEIYDQYNNGYKEFNRIIYADKFFSKYFYDFWD